MKNILFLTDFSKPSIHAMHYVCRFLDNSNVNYHILNISKAGSLSLSNMISSDSIYNTVVGDDKEKIKEIKNSFETQYKGSFKASLRFNSFIDAVQEYVNKHAIDLIVSGFDGANSISEKIFGSNTLQLIRSTPVNTIIIPEEAELIVPNKILCLLDEYDDIKQLLSLSIFHERELHVVRVINNNDFSTASKDEFELRNNESVSYQLISNIPMQYVKSFVMQTNKIDATVLMIEESSLLDRLFVDNSTTNISKNLKKPIFILHQ